MSDVRQDVTAGRAGPLCRLRRRNYGARNRARQIAAKKKSGPMGPERFSLKDDTSLRQLILIRRAAKICFPLRVGWFGGVDRASSDGHTDQEDRHGSTGEEGEFGIVPTAKRSSDPEPEQGDDEPDLASIAPGRSRHEPAQTQTHDPANLEENDEQLENSADTGRG